MSKIIRSGKPRAKGDTAAKEIQSYMLNIRALSLGLILFLVGAREIGMSAATLLTEDFTALIGMAQWVAEVEVTAAAPGKPHAGIPRTLYTLKVNQLFKGELSVAEITAEALGGADGEQRVVVPGQVNFQVGDRAILLLTKTDPAQSNWRILGGDAGHLIIAADIQGTPLVRRAAGSFDFYQRDARSLTGYAHYSERALSREMFDALLDAVLSTGKPVVETQASAQPAQTAPALQENPRTMPATTLATGRMDEPPSHSTLLALGRMLIAVGLVSGVWLISRRMRTV